MDYSRYVDVVPDFPKKGISFKDVSPLLRDPEAFKACIAELAEHAEKYRPDVIMGAESRGFVFGSALALKMGLSFVMVRKPGKLPGEVLTVSYGLEYGRDSFEIEAKALRKGERALLVDDLIATGGSLSAMEKLARLAGAEPVGALAVISLRELGGAAKLGVPCESLVSLSSLR